MINASIITIGDELLIGQTIDTNSAWMAQELNRIGVWVKRRVAVGDVWDQIWTALDQESAHSDIILITGGLGPTADDITKPLLCQYFPGDLIVNEEALRNVKDIFTRLNRPMLDRNLRQAEVPESCKVIQNTRGTAPGMWFEKNGKIYVSMPGVPHEMKGMMEKDVLPMLQASFSLPFIRHKTLLTAGIGESFLAEMIQDFEQSLEPHIKLAYLPSYGMVKLRLTVTGSNEKEITEQLDRQFKKLKEAVGTSLVTDEDEGLEKVVGKLLLRNNATVATAESCTGGAIGQLLTSVPGSSSYFMGGIISYDNRIKTSVLGVDNTTLQQEGAVSESVVCQMALGAIKRMNTDYAVATSGIMGPDGGTPDKPVGTVWMAVSDGRKVESKKLQLRFDRKRNTEITVLQALDLLRRFILETSSKG